MSTCRKLRNKGSLQITLLNKSRGQPGMTWNVLKQFLPNKHSQNQCLNPFSANDFNEFFSSIGNEVTNHYGPTVLPSFPSQTSKRFEVPH